MAHSLLTLFVVGFNILGILPLLTNGELFTAMADMEMLLGAEKEVTSVIDQYVELEMKRLEKLKKYAANYETRNNEALEAGINYLAHPVNAFLVIKRLTSDWGYVEHLMKNNMAEEFIKNITGRRRLSVVKFPDQEDLTGAAVALMRLQDTYRLDTTEIASGKIRGVKKAEELTAHDCFELGRTAYNQQDYYHTLMWMQEAINRVEHEQPPTASEEDMLEYLAYALYQQGNVKRALSMTKRLAEIAPHHPRAAGNVKWYEDELEAAGQKRDLNNLPPTVNPRPKNDGVEERELYEALCRNEVPVSPKQLSKLYCYYKNDRPYLRLAPIKVEILRFNPLAVQFKHVLSDEEIKVIKELAKPKLARATVQNSQTGELETASYRISKSAWLKHEEHPVVARVNRRMGLMTNLNMDTAEDLQIANYGIGGHYEPHFDMSTRGEKDPYIDGTGNRIATVLFYLSQPEAGGATVFPELKTAIFPIKGDAIFWYNLHRDGEGDMTTRHAACPVLSGIKWVANKWIHERGQEWQRPCALKTTINENYVGEL